MDKLRPCPFCGSFKIKAVIDGHGKWHLECKNCGIINIEFDGPMEIVKEGADPIEELHKGLMELELLLRRAAEGGEVMIIDTCPKCGADLLDITIATYPPIPCKWCTHCGWRWEGKAERIGRVPFEPPKE